MLIFLHVLLAIVISMVVGTLCCVAFFAASYLAYADARKE